MTFYQQAAGGPLTERHSCCKKGLMELLGNLVLLPTQMVLIINCEVDQILVLLTQISFHYYLEKCVAICKNSDVMVLTETENGQDFVNY